MNFNILSNAGGKFLQERKNNMEKYGEVPPRFTKAWWAYFWEYYKVHTLVTVGVVAAVAITVTQCVKQPSYDLSVMYANSAEVTENIRQETDSAFSELIDDVTGDGKAMTSIQALPISSLKASDEQSYAMITKLSLNLQASESDIFIVSRDIAESFISNEAYSGCFMSAEELNIDKAQHDVLELGEGSACGVSISGMGFFEEMELPTEDTYLFVRRVYSREEGNEKLEARHENAMKAAEVIFGN